MKQQRSHNDATVVSRDIDTKMVQLRCLIEKIDQAKKTLIDISSQSEQHAKQQQDLISDCKTQETKIAELLKQKEILNDEIVAMELKHLEMTDVMTGLQVSIMDTTNQIDISKHELQKQILLNQEKEKELGVKYEKSVKLYMEKLANKKKECEDLEYFINTIHKNVQINLFELVRCREEMITMNFSGKVVMMPREFYQNFPLLIDIWNKRTICPHDKHGNPYVLLSPNLINSLVEWYLTDNIKYSNVEEGVSLLQLLGQLGCAVFINGDIQCFEKFTNGFKLYDRIYNRVINDYTEIIQKSEPLPDLWMIYIFCSKTPINFEVLVKNDGDLSEEDDLVKTAEAEMIIFAGRFMKIQHPVINKYNFTPSYFNYSCKDGSIIYGNEKRQSKMNVINFSILNHQYVECYLHKYSLFVDKTENNTDLDNCFLTGWDDLMIHKKDNIGAYLGQLKNGEDYESEPIFSRFKDPAPVSIFESEPKAEWNEVVQDDLMSESVSSAQSSPEIAKKKSVAKECFIKKLKINLPKTALDNFLNSDEEFSDDEYGIGFAKKESLKVSREDKSIVKDNIIEEDVILSGDPIFKQENDEFDPSFGVDEDKEGYFNSLCGVRADLKIYTSENY
jgi:hypothetical protein